MKTIKRWLKRYTPQWVLAIGFLVVMVLMQIIQDMSNWFKGENI